MAASTQNRVVIAAPLAEVWRRTNDVARWTELFDEYAAAEVLDATQDRVRFRLTTKPDPSGASWSWVSERNLDHERHIVHARRVEPGPFEYMNLHWYYTEVPGGTELRWVQEFEMKPSAPVNDADMARRINANTPVQMELIRTALESAA